MKTIAAMREKLSVFAPLKLEILDDSAKHAGHEGAKSGGGHFHMTIVSKAFAGHARIARHRMVYRALSGMMHKEIHALSIQAYAPDEITTATELQPH